MKKQHLLISLGFFFLLELGVQETITYLDKVVISDTRVQHYADGYKVSELKDSTIQRNGVFLTSLLAFNSNTYFKKNDLGIVSSIAFCGTKASHTGVIRNGINTSFQLDCQVDLMTHYAYTVSEDKAIPESKLQCQLGITLNNVFNAYYENIALRPMPNRNT